MVKLCPIHHRQLWRPRFFKPFFLMLFLVALTSGTSIPCCGLQAATDSYIAGFEGLPLMPGLTEKTEDRVIFDTPAGRIVEATTWGAVGTVSAQTVRAFYANTLPQLGWHREDAQGNVQKNAKAEHMSFKREGERLLIEFPPEQSTDTAKQAGFVVRFTIRPITKP